MLNPSNLTMAAMAPWLSPVSLGGTWSDGGGASSGSYYHYEGTGATGALAGVALASAE
jgi:hypothetical protein